VTEALEKVKKSLLLKRMAQCEYVPSHGEGTHIANTRGILNGRQYKVTYDMMLCKFCGNLEGSPNNQDFCPALMKALLLNESHQTERKE
jgi:hypothetical protein